LVAAMQRPVHYGKFRIAKFVIASIALARRDEQIATAAILVYQR
jgi:hypothetical protein